MESGSRTAWVDAAKGISILLVVAMYAAYSTGEVTHGIGFLHYLVGFATPFRMPEFFLISGLFLSKVIDRPWARYADRRVVHYFYFYLLWAFVLVGLKHVSAGEPAGEIARQLALALVYPFGALWFIYVLGLFGIAVKLCRQAHIPHWAALGTGALLQMADPVSSIYVANQCAIYFVYFYAGYAFASFVFDLAHRARENAGKATLGLLAWSLVNGALVFSDGYQVLPDRTQMGYAAFPPLRLALALSGSLCLCVLAAMIAERRGFGWLQTIGRHSLVIYVSFFIPMWALRTLALKSGVLTDTGLLSAVLLAFSTATPLALHALVNRTGFGRFLFERPNWAHIGPKR
ncbi:MAG: acyltransferase family protein [Rhodoblastus sp.]